MAVTPTLQEGTAADPAEPASTSGIDPTTFPNKASRLLRLASRFASNLTTLMLLLVVWQGVSTLWLPRIDPYMAVLMPPPTTIAVTAASLIASGELLYHLLASLGREGMAFLFSLSAIPIGIAMGWSRAVHAQLDPVLEVLRPIPPLAWIPLSILWFGIGDQQNEFIIFLGMFFPILINTVDGVRTIEPNLLRAARALGAREHNVLMRIVVHAASPRIVTGIRIGLGVGWMALVAAELVGASSGLGFLINDARSVLRTDIIVVGMLTIGLMGLAIDVALRIIARRFMPWSLAMAK
jgi:ABC-type nitrate/sulfonate/bicarbonate transport system permease component